MHRVVLAALGALVLATQPAIAAPSKAHADAVANAQKSAYLATGPDSTCTVLTEDAYGWPGGKMRACAYTLNDLGLPPPGKREGFVVLLDISPERTAQWIETACAKLMFLPTVNGRKVDCFARVLDAARGNSGMMFAISGNVPEDMGAANRGHFLNYTFRHGMTVNVRAGVNGKGDVLSMQQQKDDAAVADDQIAGIPSGMTRLWRTTPNQMRARFPDLTAQLDLAKAPDRLAWFALVKAEMLRALEADDNRLLEAWFCAHAADLMGNEASVCAPHLATPSP